MLNTKCIFIISSLNYVLWTTRRCRTPDTRHRRFYRLQTAGVKRKMGWMLLLHILKAVLMFFIFIS